MLKMKNIYKSFGGVHALKGVEIEVIGGEIHALIGENGAGKSTLMKILAGAIHMDEGSISIDDNTTKYNNPKEAFEVGISVIYQELNMAPHLTVMENIFLGNFPSKNGIVKWKEMHDKADSLLKGLGAHISANAIVRDLSVAQQQMVEIAKAIKNNSKIIVFDEPSAVLGKKDTEILFSQIEKLKNSGIAIIYISHRLDEILRIADRVTVLRDGENVITKSTRDLKMQDLISYMTGKSYDDMWSKSTELTNVGDIALEVKGLTKKNVLKNISFNIKKGEVVGLAGLVGSGRTEIARAIFGADKKDSGEIFIFGKKVNINKPSDAIRNGIGFVLEDRKNQGLLLERPIFENITLTNLKKYSKYTYLNSKLEMKKAKNFKDQLQIKTNNIHNPVLSLSGGNQQKVAIAKWLHIEPEILILDEPTRGVDIGAKTEIYKIIENLKRQGKAILLISSEFAEILGLSDRIIVIRRGEIQGEFLSEEASKDTRMLEALIDEGGNSYDKKIV